MKKIHLTEEELQQYLLDQLLVRKESVSHLDGCEACRERLSVYQLLFTELARQEPAVFSFDLASMVVAKMAEPAAVGPDPAAVAGTKMAEPAPRRAWFSALIILSVFGLAFPVVFLVI